MHLEIPRESARDRFLIVRSLPAFAPLPDEALNIIAEHTRPRFFQPGEVLFEEGSPAQSVYLVHQGTVTLSTRGHTISHIEAPGGVGFLSVLANAPLPEAVAQTAVAALELPVDVLLETMEMNFIYQRNSLRLSSGALLDIRGSLPRDPSVHLALDIGQWRDRPQTLVEKMLEVQDGFAFQGANIDAIIDLARLTEEVRFEAGQTIWNAGEPSDFSVRINYGIVRCESPDGRHVEVGADFIAGALDILGHRPRAYSAVTTTPVVATRTRRDDMLALLEMHPELGMKLVRLFAANMLREMTKAPKSA